jgi:anti-anti-sigma factor
MDIKFSEIEGLKKVSLAGRLDTAGVDQVELRFTAGVAAGGQSTMVDLTHVEFLTSLGVRMLLSTARALSSKGAKLVMYGANPAVLDTIETMGFNDVVPLAASESAALALLKA